MKLTFLRRVVKSWYESHSLYPSISVVGTLYHSAPYLAESTDQTFMRNFTRNLIQEDHAPILLKSVQESIRVAFSLSLRRDTLHQFPIIIAAEDVILRWLKKLTTTASERYFRVGRIIVSYYYTTIPLVRVEYLKRQLILIARTSHETPSWRRAWRW